MFNLNICNKQNSYILKQYAAKKYNDNDIIADILNVNWL